MLRRVLIASLALALGCGGPSGGAGTTPEGESDRVPSPPRPWAEMSGDEHRAWMVEEVLPRMTVAFQAHDAERYANFGCATCHGPGARERGFEMPSPALPALYPTGSPEQQQMVREHGDMVRFMFNRVLPPMQTLLGAADFDAETQQGFSCYACHPHAGEPGTTPVRLQRAPAESEAEAAP